MSAYPVPANEALRNDAVRRYAILDTAPEIPFDDVGELAARICQCPVSYVAFAEHDRLWFKAKYGLPPDMTGCPRDIAFCQVTICGTEMVLSPDLTTDPRFRDFHFVVNEPHLALDDQESLRRLARQLVGQLELRRKLIEIDETMAELEQARQSIADAKARADELLANILPASIAAELTENVKVSPRHFSEATILFTDFRDFTGLAERTEPAMLVGLLDQYFSAFDEIVARHRLE